MGATEWAAVRPNLSTVDDAASWWQVIEGPVDAPAPAAEDREYLAAAARVAAGIDWSGDPWHSLTGELKAETGRKGKALFLPLRLALTGLSHGPDMAALLPLIGRKRTLERLMRS
jgi:glutamyl-tRNA synthetase